MDRGTWQATVHGVAKSWTWLKEWAETLVSNIVYENSVKIITDAVWWYLTLERINFCFWHSVSHGNKQSQFMTPIRIEWFKHGFRFLWRLVYFCVHSYPGVIKTLLYLLSLGFALLALIYWSWYLERTFLRLSYVNVLWACKLNWQKVGQRELGGKASLERTNRFL